MAVPPDRGDDGAVPDPSWEEHWSTWAPEAVQRRIAEAATYGILSPIQVSSLLQGLPPPSMGADPTNTCLAEFQDVVGRFRQDAEKGRVSRTPTPQELAAWAAAMGAVLPEPFLLALESQAVKVGESRVGTAPGGLTVKLPPWVPQGMDAAPVAIPSRRRVGRPTTLDAALPAMVAAARELLDAEAQHGRTMTLLDIGGRLQGTPVAGDRSAARIKKLLNGQLDVEKARRKALAVASKPKR